MKIKNLIKRAARMAGLELHRYTPSTSNSARLLRILSYHDIDLVLDVGANVGQYAQYIRHIGYRGRIVSFEPLSSAHAQLLADSSHDRLWEIAPQMAIGDQDRDITINISRNSVSSSLLPMLSSHQAMAPDSEYQDKDTVRMHTLDTVAQDYLRPDTSSIYIKIDVQGYEQKVLQGAASILSRVKGFQLELSLIPLYEGEVLFPQMLQIMNDLGFALYAVIPGLTDNASGRLLQLDGIFFRKGI